MRPPKREWQKTVKAFEELFNALEAVALKVPVGNPTAAGGIALALTNARKEITALKEHVETSEECEEA